MRKLYYFFVNGGKVICIWAFMFVLSITFQSLVIKGKVDYGNRCTQVFNDEFIVEYEYEGILLKEGKLECNTYYLQYQTQLVEEKNIMFLSSISKLFYDNNVNCNIHIILQNSDYQIIATIVDYKVSYIKSLI